MGDDAGDLLEVVEEAPAKKSSSKDKKKDSKSSSKKSKKEEPAPFVVVEEEPAPAPEPEPEPAPLEDEREAPKADGWGFWGASLKSSKKAAPPAAKEIASDSWANEGASAFVTADQSKMPEVSFADDGGDAFALPKSKSSKSSKIQDRIKALQPEPEPVKSKKSSKTPSASSTSSGADAAASDAAQTGPKKKTIRSAITYSVTQLGYEKHPRKEFKRMQDRYFDDYQ